MELTPHLRRVLHRIGRDYIRTRRDDDLAGRARLKASIEAEAVNGMVGLIITERDCDMCQATWGVVFPATVVHFLGATRHRGEEGPVWWNIVSPEEANEQGHDMRDLALEAFEDGHPHVISA